MIGFFMFLSDEENLDDVNHFEDTFQSAMAKEVAELSEEKDSDSSSSESCMYFLLGVSFFIVLKWYVKCSCACYFAADDDGSTSSSSEEGQIKSDADEDMESNKGSDILMEGNKKQWCIYCFF